MFSEAAKRVEEVGKEKLDITEPLVKDLLCSPQENERSISCEVSDENIGCIDQDGQ